MEFLGKDKLAALEEEKQQRRKARADEAQKRLAEIGKSTQQMVADHVSPGGAAENDQEAKTQRIGALSRVLYEQATDVDGRRGSRRNRGLLQNAFHVQNTGRDALRTIDDAMRHVNSVAQDVTSAGLSGGLEGAARSVTDAVNRVSAAAALGRRGTGGLGAAAHNNPLADLMQRDADETAAERRQDQARDREHERDPRSLARELGGLGGLGGEIKARAFAGLELDEPGNVRNLIGHEAAHVVQQRAGRLVGFGREIAESPGRALEAARSTAEELGERAARAPRELLQTAQDLPREALARAASAPREIADGLRDAPDHVVDNVQQIAQHVEHGHRGLLGELRDAGQVAREVTVRGPSDALRELVHEAPRTVASAANVANVANVIDSSNVVGSATRALETAREHVDPRRLADAAADALSPRSLVDGAVKAAAAAGITDVPRHLDPRAIAEQALGAVDPRALVRGSVDPKGILDQATTVGAAAKNLVTPSQAHGEGKHVDHKHAEAHHAAAAHPATHAGGAHANHAAPAAHATHAAHAPHGPAHGSAHHGAAHPAAPHSATQHPHPANPSGHSPPQAAPNPGPHGPPTNHTPATARQPAAPHTPSSKSKATVNTNAAGETQIALQPVASAAPAPTDRKQQVVQPSFQIQGKGENPAPPPLDAAPQVPRINAPAPAQPAPVATHTSPTTAQRAVPPLAPAAASSRPTANPAIAGARAAAAGVKVPQGSISPLPASSTSVAPSASPVAPSSSAAGPGAVKTAANAPTAPTATAQSAAAMPAAPVPAAPATNSPVPAAPTVAPVSAGGGGDSVPDPSSMVQSTVSLSPDRSATAAAITSEAQTQSKVGPEAASARAAQINPLGPQMATTGHSADAPMASASTSAQAEGTTAGTQAKANEAAREAQGKQQVSSQMTGAQAERSQFAAMPPPPILQQTAAGAMAPVTQAAQTAVQAAASAVSASVANLDPAAVARAHAAGAVSSTLPAFDAGRFAALDQHAPLPQTNTTSVDAANAVAASTYAQTTAQIQTLANIPAPVANAPSSPGAGTKTSGGYPTREAAIAEVEQQVTAQANAQGPGQMKAAAAPVQAQLTNHVTTNQQTAQAQQTTALAEAQAHAQAIAQQPPPITGAQAAAAAKPQYDAHQAEATQAHTQLQQSITQAQQTAQTGVTQSKGQRDQQVSTAQSGYTQDVQGQVMPQYATAQAAANQGFQQASSTAQTTLGSDQQTAQTQAAADADAAKAKADADISSHQTALHAQQTQAAASHQQQAASATAAHDAQMRQQQTQMDAHVQQQQSDMHSQVSAKQTEGQAQINSHLNEGEQGYQSQIAQGTEQANAEKAKAEAAAAAKKQEADAEKKKHSGGFLGGIVGWVKDRVDDLMNAVKSLIEAAKNLVVSIMEKARQAAMAVLEKARQAALAVMNTVKGAIQGIISACAAAIRSIIDAVAATIKGLIQELASALQALVAELTSMLHALVSAFQAAMNAALDMLISAVSLVNKNLGDKLRNATQKYRDAFNGAMNGLKANIDKAGQALQHGIQSAADRAMSVVDAAQKTLDDAVTRVEQTLNNAVEAAYNLGTRAVNAAFDAAEAVVNTAFDIAEAGVKAFFDVAIAQIALVQQGIDAIADFAAEVADKVMEACDKLAQAVVSLIPDSFKKAFVDFWNGPWRSIIIIGLVTIVAVALTVATGGVAGVLLAGLIGGTLTGGAYFGGEMIARESEISLSKEGKGMYIPGFGDVQIGPDGKPVPPPGLSPDKQAEFEKQAGWAASNFNLTKDENGQVTGYDRKSSTDISNAALAEGAKGFVEGAIASSLSVVGGAAGSLVTKGLGLAETTIAGSLVSAGISNVVTGPIQSSLTTGFDAAFEAIKNGESPGKAFMAGLKAGGDVIKDPTQWATAFLTMGIAPAKMKFLQPLLESSAAKQGESALAKALITKGGNAVVSTVENTFTSVGGQFAGTYAKALSEGKTPAQALEAARAAADAAFTPEAIATTALMSAAGSVSHKSQAQVGDHEHAPPSGEHGPSSEHGPSEDHTTPPRAQETSTTPSRETTSRTAQEEAAAAANTATGSNEHTVVASTERTTSTETHGTPQHETVVERTTQSERTSASSTERTTSADQHTVVTERIGLDEKTQVGAAPRANEGSTKEAASSTQGAAGAEEPIFGWSKAEKEAKAAKAELAAEVSRTVGGWDASFDLKQITPENIRAVEARAAVESVQALPGYQHLNDNEKRALTAVLGGETNVLSAGVREKLRPEFVQLKAGTPEEQAAALRGALDTKQTMSEAWIPEPLSAPVASSTREPPTDHAGFQFNGMTADAEVHVVRFADGESIKVIVPKSPDPAFHNHSIDEAIESTSYLSKAARAQLEEVQLHPSRNPDDAYWAVQYNTVEFRSYMTAGVDGKITIYARETPMALGDALGRNSAVVHETGHTWSFREWGVDENQGPGWAKWKAAMAEDVVAGTKYATNSTSEDVAETIRIYTTAKGTPRFAEYEKILGKRFEILRETYDAAATTPTASAAGSSRTAPISESSPSEHATNGAPKAANDNDPPSLLPEHQDRLQQIAMNPEGGAPRETISAVNEARVEIAKLERLRSQADKGSGMWEHATPEERAAKVKELDDQIKTTAAVAVEHYDKTTTKAQDDAATLAEIHRRTPAELESRTQVVAKARELIVTRDTQLVTDVHSNTIKIDGAEHVNQVYDHLTIGSGFAGTANEMSRPNVHTGDIIIGGKNPWDGAAAKLGQQAGQSELPNARPGMSMAETHGDPEHRYMLASEHADNVAINKADQGLRTYDGKSGPIEPGPGAGWPSFATEGGANTRMKVTGPDGVERYFYSKQTDVAAGPGPSRRLPTDVLDPATMQRMRDAQAFAFSDQGFAGTSVREGEIGNIGAGAAGAWASEATANVEHSGQRINQVEWLGARPNERTQSAEAVAKLRALINENKAAIAANAPARIQAAHDQLAKFTFSEAAGNGALPRNRLKGAAFDPEMQSGAVGRDGKTGNISRRVVDKIEKITFEPQVAGGPDRVKIVVTGIDGQPAVMWKDALILSIGQDAAGKGGPKELVSKYQGELKPIYGPADATGFRPIIGVQSLDGNMRILGAAATTVDVSAMMAPESKGGVSVAEHQDNLKAQAATLHDDSRNVVQGFVLAQKHIEAANAVRERELASPSKLAETLEHTSREQSEAIKGKRPGIIPLADGPIDATPSRELPPEVRQAAREKYSDQITALESDGQIAMPRGKASVDMMASITAATGKEVALLRLPNGERVMRIGNESSVELVPGTKIIAHTHPEGNLQFSSEDEAALAGVGQHSSVLIAADGSVGRFRTAATETKSIPADQRDKVSLREPEQTLAERPVAEKPVALEDTNRYQKFVKDADSLHKNITEQQRLEVVSDFPVKMITSAPGHHDLRSPEAMLGMSRSMTEAGTGSIFNGGDKIKLNIFTEEVNGHVRVKSIEVQDGNHRLAAGLHAEKWNSIKDIPAEYLAVAVNGFDTNGVQHPRWIPLHVAAESTIPKDQWFEVPTDWKPKGPTAQVSGGLSSQDLTIPEHYRGVPMDRVIAHSLERTQTPPVPTVAAGLSLREPPRTAEQQRRVSVEEIQQALRLPTGEELVAKAIRPDISGPLANDQGKSMGAKLGPVPPGMVRLVDGTLAPSSSHGVSAEARAFLAKSGERQSGPRKVVVDGGGPTGALAAIQAFHAGHEVTVVEMREAATLPVLWSNRPGSMDILASIDPVLAERVGGQSNKIKFYEHVDADGEKTAFHAEQRAVNAEGATGDPRAIAGESSSWQSQNKTEVTLMWDRLVELEAKEKIDAAAAGREPRIKLMRGYQVTELPAGEGNKRAVVVQKMEQRLTKIGADGKPEMSTEGKPITMPYKDGDPVPAGFKVERAADGVDVHLGTPDDMFIAEGAGSKTRALAGAKSLDVGPSAQYIAGYFHGETLKSVDAEGRPVQGGSRSIEERGKNGDIIHAVAGSGEHLDGTWALPEVDPALNLKDPASIEKYFGEPMSAKAATLKYYKQQIAKVLEVSPERIPDNAFEMGPAAFTVQSHVSSPVAEDAGNVHLIGDSRGNSHFLASLGKVTGTGTHQMAIKQYFQALDWGMNPDVAHALLERRLDAGTRAWLKSGLPSLTGFKYPEGGEPLGGLGSLGHGDEPAVPGSGRALHEPPTGAASYTSAGSYAPAVAVGSGKVIASTNNVRLNGSGASTGPQEILIAVPANQQGMRLANIELTHSQVLGEKSNAWTGSKTDVDTTAAYSLVEVNVEGKGWTSLGQRKKFPEARVETERLHDLPAAEGKIIAVRVRNVGVDPLHVQGLALHFLPPRPGHFDESILTPGTSFGDAWSGRPPQAARLRDAVVAGTRYPGAIVLNNRDWTVSSPEALAKAHANGWTVDGDSLLVPLTPGKRFKLAEVALGDTHPDPNTNGDGSYGVKGYSKLSMTIERKDGSRVVLSDSENVPPQGVLAGSADHLIEPGDRLRVRVSQDTAGVMGLRVGYDEPNALHEPTKETAQPDFGSKFQMIDRTAGGSQGGRWYADEAGTNYFGKTYKGDPDRLGTEQLANSLYHMFGVSAAENQVVKSGDATMLMSKEMKGAIDAPALGKSDVADGFIIDAWLANQDVVGAMGDNVLLEGRQSHRVDNGSSFMFRARGDLKPFGAAVHELDSMRDPKYPAGKLAFSKLSEADVAAQIRAFSAKYAQTKDQIEHLVDTAGLTPAIRDQIKASLRARAEWMMTTGLATLETRIAKTEAPTPEQTAREPVAPSRGPGVEEVSPELRIAASTKYAAVVTRLETGDMPVKTGAVDVEMMRGIMLATGREVALLRHVSGERFLRLGGAHSVELPEAAGTLKIIAHTHPGGDLLLSEGDSGALADHGQRSTVVITPTRSARLRPDPSIVGGEHAALHEPEPEPKSQADVAGDLSRLDPIQMAVVKDTFEKALARSQAAHPALETRMMKFGYTAADLQKTLDFIRMMAHAQIQFSPDKALPPGPDGKMRFMIDGLLADGTYKNQFETRVSSGYLGPDGGSARDGWEQTNFLGGYNTTPLVPPQRPKYGALNAANTPDAGAKQYGTSSLVLRESIKSRTTFTPDDSALADPNKVGTAESFEHVLNYCDDNGLRAIVDAALGRPQTTSHRRYVEAQIHGPLELNKDVSEIIADSRYKGTPYEPKLRELATQNGVPLKWRVGVDVTDDVPPPVVTDAEISAATPPPTTEPST